MFVECPVNALACSDKGDEARQCSIPEVVFLRVAVSLHFLLPSEGTKLPIHPYFTLSEDGRNAQGQQPLH